MKLSYDKIKEIFPHFNELPLNDQDFWLAAKHMRIIVQEIDLLVDGYYSRKRGIDLILIHRLLRGWKWTHTAFHELFHAILDVPVGKGDIKFYRSRQQIRSKQEKIVDALALIAILPRPDLERLRAEDLTDNPELARLVLDRIAVLSEYGY